MPYNYLITLEKNQYTLSRDGIFKQYFISPEGVALKINSEGKISKASKSPYALEACSNELEYQIYKIVYGLNKPFFEDEEPLMGNGFLEIFRQLILDDQNGESKSWFPQADEYIVLKKGDLSILVIEGGKYVINNEYGDIKKIFF